MNTMFHEEMVRQHISDLREAARAGHVAKIARRRDRSSAWRRAIGTRLVDAGLSLMNECRPVTLQASK
ncbi:MAG: hypothetical protein M3290_06425 [Actinomycetota bacterium]|nr:hypothetical protein [Actinomycetota bacterium]